jgi:hypothetical protein
MKLKPKIKLTFAASLTVMILVSCYFIPKIDRIAWRATSLVEFKLLKALSRFYDIPVDNPNRFDNILASHRGVFSKIVTENSEKSVIMSAKNGFRYIELDVSFSKDQVPIIFHDRNLKSKTNFARLTSETYWKDIQKLTLPDNQKILSLKYLLSEYSNLFDGIILDIKGDDDHYYKKANSFCKVISESHVSEKIYVIGKPFLVLSTIKKVNPKLKVGCENQGSLYNYFSGKDLISLHYGSQFSNIEYVIAKKFGLDVIIWTINDQQELENLKNFKDMIVLTDLHFANL